MLPRLRAICRAPVSTLGAPCCSLSTTIDVSKLKVTKTSTPKPHVAKEKLLFGVTTTDHILEVDWDVDQGWSAPTISPYHNFSLDPACSVFHYGLSAFEGMKAYKDAAGRVRLFRPGMNMARLARSMARMALGPPLDQAGMQACIARFAALEAPWIPSGDGYSLYLRPTVMGTQATLGVTASRSLKLFTMATPVGPYYTEGFKALRIYAEAAAVRAWPGGTGDVKLGGNYAPTIAVQRAAAARGYSQVLWLFGPELTVTEVGTSNLFVLWRPAQGAPLQLITAPLDGTILPGVTRDSILELARAWGEFEVVERSYGMQELAGALQEGRVVEMFGAGTAAVVSPIKGLHFGGVDYDVPLDRGDASAGAGPVTRRFWKELLDIQYGRKEYKDWSVVVG